MPPDTVKNQHYVPQFYLRHFASATERIFAFDKKLKRSFSTSVEKVASDNRFYDIHPALMPPGAPPQLVENVLSRLEGAAGSQLRDILKSLKDRSYFYPLQKDAFASYLGIQAVRTHEARTAFQEVVGVLGMAVERMEHQLNRPLNMERELNFLVDEQIIRLQHAKAMFGEIGRNITEILKRHVWVVGRNRTSQPFFTSDQPIAKHAHVEHPVLSMSGFDCRGVEVIFPLSPEYVLCMFERSFHRFSHRYEFNVVDLEEQDVEGYNVMQVLESRRQIFAPSDSFELCHRLLRDHPELSDIDRSRTVTRMSSGRPDDLEEDTNGEEATD